MMIFSRLVWARAIMAPSVVASVPFLTNTAQSAWLTMPVKRSANSTITGETPVRVSVLRICSTKALLISSSP
jgi:hypothetical protein